MSKNNITLIGMPGSGKSFIGKRLADKLGYQLFDLDSILEQEHNLPLQKILDNLGEKSFLRKQAEDVMNIKDQSGLVISPGGSIVYTSDAMEHLKKVSTIIYLKTPLKTTESRIQQNSRGIVGLKDKTLENLYQERSLLYEKYAQVTVDGDQKAEKVVDEILRNALL